MQMKKVFPVLACALVSLPASALNIVFNYDASSYFYTEERRDALDRAAAEYEKYITNDVNIFVTLTSARDTNYLASAGPFDWYDNFQSDWGGIITFNESENWYSGTSESFSGFDLFSVAIHELGHVLGFGILVPWTSLVVDGYFIGENSVSLYGGPVPLGPENGSRYDHWNEYLISTLPGTETWQMVSYSPYAYPGERRYLTDLDLAGLKDMGWAVAVPEPEMLYMLLSGLGLVGIAARRRRHVA